MEKIILNYSASGQRLKPLYSLKKFASDTVNYVVAVFDLDESWAFDSVRAVWKTENACISTVLDQDGACIVPQEVLQKKAKVEVNLVGSDVENDQLVDRLTTYPVQAFIVDRDVPICGSETAEITPSQFEQFVQIVTTEVAKIRDVDRVELNDDYTITFYYSDGTESPKIGPIRGETGADGNGIQSITKIGSEGRIDTYRIAYTNGGHFDFNVTNGEKGDRGEQGETGNGIDRIEKTATEGSVDTYTIYFTDGSTTTFTVTNGEVTKAELEELLPTESASGSIVSFPDGQSVFPMKSLKVNLEPIQDLHGYDSPWVGGAGANLLNSDYAIKFTLSKTITFPQTILSGTKVYIHSDGFSYTTPPSSGNKYPYYVFRGANNENRGQVWGLSDTSVTLSGDAVAIELWSNGYNYGASSGVEVTISGLTISKTEQTTYSPYENICPISGRTEVVTIVSPTTSASDGQTYTTALGRTVYGGTLDVVSGVLTVDRAMVTLNGGETWTASNGTATACMRVQTRRDVGFKPNASNTSLVGDISSAFVEVTPNQTWDGTIGFSVSTDATNPYFHFCQTGQKNMSVEAWKTYLASNPIQVVGLLATPQTYQLTPQQIQTLVGRNNVWSEDGDVDVTYKADIQLYVDKKTGELAVAIAAL